MNPHGLSEPAAPRTARTRGRATARHRAVRYAAVFALVGSLLAPVPSAAQHDDGGASVPDLTPADPVFNHGAAVTLSIAEGHADGAVVGTVDATDANDDTLTYSLSGTDAASFAIDAATGEISVAAGVALDHDTKPAHSVTVGVSDGKDAQGATEADPTQDAAIAVTIEVTAAPDGDDDDTDDTDDGGSGDGDDTEDGGSGDGDDTEDGGSGDGDDTEDGGSGDGGSGDDTENGDDGRTAERRRAADSDGGPTAAQEPTRPTGCTISGSDPSNIAAFGTPVASSSTISLTTRTNLGAYAWKLFLCDSSGTVWNATDSSSAVIEGTMQTPSGNTYVVHGGVNPSDSNSTTTIMPNSDYWVTVRQTAGGQFSWQYVRTPVPTRPAGCTLSFPQNTAAFSTPTTTSSTISVTATGTRKNYAWEVALCDSSGKVWKATDSSSAVIGGAAGTFNGKTFVIHGGVDSSDDSVTTTIMASSDYWVTAHSPSISSLSWAYARTQAPPAPTTTIPAGCGVTTAGTPGNIASISATDSTISAVMQSATGYGWQMRICDSAGQIWAATDSADAKIEGPTRNFDDNPATFVIHGGVDLRDSLITFDIAASSDYWVCFGGPSNQDTFAFTCQYIRTAPPVPAVTSVAFSSDPGGGGLYALGEHIDVTLTFDESVTVTGTPRLKIKLADTTGTTDERWAEYSSGSASTGLVFRYTPVANDASAGVAVVENSLELNSGTINSTASSDTAALLGHVGLGHDTGHQIDTVAPTVTSVVYRPADRVYLVFSEDMAQSPKPTPTTLAYTIDGTAVDLRGFGDFVENDVVAFTPASRLASTQVGKLAYDYDSAMTAQVPLKDLAGNLLADFTGTSAKTVSIVSDPSFDDGATLELSYPEKTGVGETLTEDVTVSATDADGDTLTYSIATGPSSFFVVLSDASAGKYKVNHFVPDFEKTPVETAVFGVSDGKDSYGRTEETATVDDTISVTLELTDVDEPPRAPFDDSLSVTAQSSSTLTLEWRDPGRLSGTHPPPTTGYDVRYFAGTADPADPADWVEPGETGGHSHSGTGTTSVVSGLSASTAYRLQVRAVNDEGVSAWTSSVSGTTTNQPTIALSVSPASLGEDAASTAVTVKATRAAAEATAASVVTLSVSGTATSGTDYEALGTLGTISLAANETEKSVSVNIDPIQDTTTESGGETIVFGGSATGGFAVTQATFTINDDDTPSTSWTLTVSPATLDEADGATAVTVKAELDGGTLASAVRVAFDNLIGTAERGGTGDYTFTDTDGTDISTPESLTIAAGETEASTTVRIDPVGDNVDESDGTTERPHETIVFTGSATGGLTTVEKATVEIIDDDTASTSISLSTSPTSFREDAAETEVTVTATLAGTATYTADRSVAVSVVSAGTTGATPGADAATGDYRLKDFDDAAVTAVTLPISLGSITIPKEMSLGTATFKVTPNNDSVSEGVEVIRLGGSLADFTVTQADINLVDDDLPPLTLTSTTSSVGEGDTGATSVTVNATVEHNTTAKVDVALTFAGGATAADYTLNPATVTLSIPSGQKTGSATFTITPIQDFLTEGAETIMVGGSHADYTVVPLTITLNDDDMASTAVTLTVDANPDMVGDQASVGEGDNAKTVTVKAKLNDGTLASNVTVTFGALAGSAMGGGTDYTASPAKPTTLTITAGTVEASTTIAISPVDDDIDEGTGENISFAASLTGALSGNATGTTLRINDNDTASSVVNLTVLPAAVGENAAETAVTVTATVSGTKTHNSPIAVPVVVAARSGNSATAGTDYTLKNFAGTAVTALTLPISLGTITIPAGMSSATETLRIDPTEDTDFEGTESDAHEYVRVGAGTVSGFTVNHADLEITENDNPTITIAVDTDTGTSGMQDSVPESAGTRSVRVTVTLDDGARSTNTAVALSFAGSANRGACTTSGNDYSVSPRSVTVSAGQASAVATLSVQVCEDRDTEGAETIIVNGTAAGFDVAGATVTIDDNDSVSTSLTITVDTVAGTTGDQSGIGEGITGARTVTVKAELDGGTAPDNVTVTFNALGGTAVRAADTTSGDYTSDPAKPETVTITAGTLSASTTIDIDPRDDMIDEDDETITIGASAVRADTSRTALSVTAGTVTITDNDTATLTLSLDADAGTAGNQTSVDEDGGAATVRVTATLSLERSADTALDLGLGGTAAFSTLPRDHIAPPALLDRAADVTIAAGATSATFDFEITPVDERFDDGDKTINVRNFTNRFGFVESNTITLVDDDAPSTLVTLIVDTDPDTDDVQSAVGEGDAASVLVTATLDDAVRDAATTVTLTFAGDAVRGSDKDYTLSGTLSVVIPAGMVSGQRTITVTPVNERIDDGNKTVTIGGTAPSGLSVSTVSIGITDNDDPPTALKVTVTPATLREQGPSGGSDCTDTTNVLCKRVTIKAEFTGTNSDVTLTSPVWVSLSVHNTDSTADRGSSGDYTAPSELGDIAGDISIDDGQTSGETTMEFTSRQDEVAEGSETIVIDAAAGGFTVAAADRATIAFTDDDVPADSLTITAAYPDKSSLRALNEAAIGDHVSGGVTAVITAELDGKASTSAVNVTLAILTPADLKNATRGTGKDYTASDNLTDAKVDIVIPATKTSATAEVVLDPNLDSVEDNDEIIRIGGTANGAITTVNALDIIITNDEKASTAIALTRSSGLDSFTEDHGAGVAYQIVATLAGGIAREVPTPVTVSFEGTAALGTDCATEGVDYTASPSPAVITIAAEARTASETVTLTPCNDDIPETPKTIEVRGTADFGNDTGTLPVASGFDIRLVDDDLPVIMLTAERVRPPGPPHDRLREGTAATFTITATRDTAETTQRVVVPIGVLADQSSADAGDDYRPLGQTTLTIADNAATATRNITVTALQDLLVEGDETIVLGGQIGDGTEFAVAPVTLTIADDDVDSTEITLTASPPSLPERGGTATVTLAAELDGAPLANGDIVIAIAADPATSTAGGDDYTLAASNPTTITIREGQTRGTVRLAIEIAADDIDEGDSETIVIAGSVAAGTPGADLDVHSAQIEITDDDIASTIIDLFIDIDSDTDGDQNSVGEDAGTVTVVVTGRLRGTKSHDTANEVGLTFTGGTAISGTDYTSPSLPGSVTLRAGFLETKFAFIMTLTQDSDVEGAETFEVRAAATGFTIWGAALTIVDDDIAEGSGHRDLPGPVRLDAPSRPSGAASARLSWSSPANPPDPGAGRPGGYRVERRSAGAPQWVTVADVAADASRYTITDPDPADTDAAPLDPDQDYQWRVTAYVTALPSLDADGNPVLDPDGNIVTTPCGTAPTGCAATPSEPREPLPPRPPTGIGGGGGGGGGGGLPTPPEQPDETTPEQPDETTPGLGDINLDTTPATQILNAIHRGLLFHDDDPAQTPQRIEQAKQVVRLWQALTRHCPGLLAVPAGPDAATACLNNLVRRTAIAGGPLTGDARLIMSLISGLYKELGPL